MIEFDQAAQAVGTWNGEAIRPRTDAASGDHVGAYLKFAPPPTGKTLQVLLRVGTSFISAEQAVANLRQEMPNWDFEAASERARAAWNRELGRIEIM